MKGTKIFARLEIFENQITHFDFKIIKSQIQMQLEQRSKNQNERAQIVSLGKLGFLAFVLGQITSVFFFFFEMTQKELN